VAALPGPGVLRRPAAHCLAGNQPVAGEIADRGVVGPEPLPSPGLLDWRAFLVGDLRLYEAELWQVPGVIHSAHGLRQPQASSCQALPAGTQMLNWILL